MARIVEDNTVSESKSVKKNKVSAKASKKVKGKAEKTTKVSPQKVKGKAEKSPHRGRTTGLRLKQAWAKVFEENTKSQVAKRMTDDQIFKFMRAEFPNKKARTLRDVSGVNVARRRYNAGKFTRGDVPSTPATAYDEKGKAVDVKNSRKKDGDEEGRRKGFPDKTGQRKSRSVRG